MDEQQAAILRECIRFSMDVMSGRVNLHRLTMKQILGLRFNDMVMEEPRVWEYDECSAAA
jgi:hypothetical protein